MGQESLTAVKFVEKLRVLLHALESRYKLALKGVLEDPLTEVVSPFSRNLLLRLMEEGPFLLSKKLSDEASKEELETMMDQLHDDSIQFV